MLIRRRKHFIIEVVQQPDQSPFIYIGVRCTVTRGGRTHRSLNRERVLSQAVAFGVLAQKFPGFFSVRHTEYRIVLLVRKEN